MSPEGQHIELGIAEQNLFLLLSALGLAHSLYGARLLPIGTVYDPFVNRGLDALIYACYQDARFLLVSTPSGLTLAPEGGQHQSINTPLLGIAQDRLASYEPAHSDELAILMRWAFEHMQKPDGSAVWLRLSTRGLEQPARTLDPAAVIAGAHWVVPPAAGRVARHRVSGAGGAGGDRRRSDKSARRCRGRACSLSPARTGCMPAGSRRGARRRAGHGAPSHIENLLAPLAPWRGAGDGAGRPPGRPCLARRGAGPARGAARRGPLRAGWRYAGPLPGVRVGRGRHSRTPARRPCWAGKGAVERPPAFHLTFVTAASWTQIGCWRVECSLVHGDAASVFIGTATRRRANPVRAETRRTPSRTGWTPLGHALHTRRGRRVPRSVPAFSENPASDRSHCMVRCRLTGLAHPRGDRRAPGGAAS